MTGDLSDLINQATPFAPANAEDAAVRLQNSALSEPASPAPSEGTEDTSKEAREATTRVFVPTSPQKTGEVAYELRETPQGTPGLAVYTSSARLVGELGEEQPYAEVEVIDLLRQVSGRAPIIIDPTLRIGETTPRE